MFSRPGVLRRLCDAGVMSPDDMWQAYDNVFMQAKNLD